MIVFVHEQGVHAGPKDYFVIREYSLVNRGCFVVPYKPQKCSLVLYGPKLFSLIPYMDQKNVPIGPKKCTSGLFDDKKSRFGVHVIFCGYFYNFDWKRENTTIPQHFPTSPQIEKNR
jgi:hypothetical protein